MNRHFDNLSSFTLMAVAAGVALLAATTALPERAVADSGVDEQERYDGEIEQMRDRASLDVVDDREPLEFRIYRRVGDTRPIWHVAGYAPEHPRDAVCRSTFPRGAGGEHYEYDYRILDLGQEGYAILVDAAVGEDGPLDPPVYQLAFQLTPRTGGRIPYNCSLVARGEYTELDGGTRLDIQTVDGQRRLVRHDETDAIDFCGLRDEEDQKAEVFDGSTGRFVPTEDVEVDEQDAESLAVDVPDDSIAPPMTDEFYTWLTASSDIRAAPGSANVPRPQMLGDLDPASAWIEGAEQLGTGEFVTAGVDSTVPLRALRIFPGHGDSREAFEGHGRPERLLIGLGDGSRWIVDVPDLDYDEFAAAGGLVAEFPEPVETDCLSVMVLEARPGDFAEADDEQLRRFGQSVVIGEITPYSVLDADDEETTADRLVDAIGHESSPRIRDRLARLGGQISSAMIEAISRKIDETEREEVRVRIIPLLGEYDYEEAIPVLTDHLRQLEDGDEDYRPTKRALAQHGSLAAPALLDMLDDIDPDDKKYVDLVRIVGRVGDDVHLRRLLPGLGQGHSRLRGERIRALAHGGIALVPALVSEAQSRGDTAGGLDALTTLVTIGRRHFSDEYAEVDGADRLREIYRASESRPHRIRTIEAIGYFAVSDPEEFLGRELLVEDPDPVIRQFAAGALQRYPGDQARMRLEDALQDRSPDVRIAAVRTLSRRDDAAEATEAVSAYVRSDRAWPQGLHHGFRLLAQSPRPEAREAIAEVVDRDLTAPATRTALRALRRAEKSLDVAQIQSHLTRETTPAPVLGQLVAMLGYADPDEATAMLVPIANREYDGLDHRSDEELDVLSRRAFLALGKTGTDEAMEFLLDVAAADHRSDTDRRHALRGLGFYSDPQVVDRLRELAPRLPDHLEERFQRTLTMIDNRLSIEDARDDVQFLIDQLEEEIQQRDQEETDDEPLPQ